MSFYLLTKHSIFLDPNLYLLSRKNSNAAPPPGTSFKDTLLRIEEEKAQHPAVIEPMISRVLLCRPALYCCATTAAY